MTRQGEATQEITSDDAPSPKEQDSLGARVALLQAQIQQTLTNLHAKSTRQEMEQRGILGDILDDLATVARLLPVDGCLTSHLEQRIQAGLKRLEHFLAADQGRPLDPEVARETHCALRCMLLELAWATGHLDFLRVRLDQEHRREQIQVSTLRWSDLFESKDLAAFRTALAHEGQKPDTEPHRTPPEALEMLITLYQARDQDVRERRTQNRTRDARLQWVARWLLQLLLPTAALLVSAFQLTGPGKAQWLQQSVQIALVILVGALGGALSGVRRLLASPLLTAELERFQAAFRAQLIVGGTLGLITLLLFYVGALPTFQAIRGFPQVTPFVLYAFLAGFSEPFVLGVVQGLIGTRSAGLPTPRADTGDR